jgi:predicted DNA-binding transcriptional regulator AlpA
MSTLNQKVFLTIGETQSFLGASRSFVYKLIKEGLRTYHVSKRTYVKTDDLLALFKPRK